MDTSLSDINEAHGTIDEECVGLSISQSMYSMVNIICKKVDKLVYWKIRSFQLE